MQWPQSIARYVMDIVITQTKILKVFYNSFRPTEERPYYLRKNQLYDRGGIRTNRFFLPKCLSKNGFGCISNNFKEFLSTSCAWTKRACPSVFVRPTKCADTTWTPQWTLTYIPKYNENFNLFCALLWSPDWAKRYLTQNVQTFMSNLNKIGSVWIRHRNFP